jgi:hypothetical protein
LWAIFGGFMREARQTASVLSETKPRLGGFLEKSFSEKKKYHRIG